MVLRNGRVRGAATIAIDEDVALMVEESKGPKEGWILDSGCSQHICCRKERFTSYKQSDGLCVTLPNGEEAKVEGIGEVEIKTHDRKTRKLREVRYISRLDRNLISLGRLDDLGYAIHIERGRLEVTKAKSVILRGRHNKQNLFILERGSGRRISAQGKASSESCLLVREETQLSLREEFVLNRS
ncbi:uncharacterized protein [Spinacia oleracea]|uniref:Retrovirus-related Pol polyprotein from transposon TNT 1-94-like beta-barrel domain-containing protein n=1 Tax=Spinacia oleracea TaxID=3562 RepID=A0ABM3R3L1_SPIOL|nr:uncharacterized protein LOC130465458 [Spinacia oleracea]